MDKQKVIIIGLDGATFDLLNPWIENGELPSFRKIKDEGTSSLLNSSFIPISAPAWTSLFTGKNEGKHGVFDFFCRQDNSYNVRPTNSRDNRCETLFSMLSRAQKKVVLINIPASYPPEPVNGILISGVNVPAEGSKFFYPECLENELKEKCGAYKLHNDVKVSRRNIKEYLRESEKVLSIQTRVALYLMNKKEWDFFMYVIYGTDQIQHNLWHLMDEKHPLYSPNNSHKDAILRFYKKIDDFLFKILINMPQEANLIILSDHGAGPLTKLININNWLLERGYLYLKKEVITKAKRLLYKMNIYPYFFLKFMLNLRIDPFKEIIKNFKGYNTLKSICLSFDDIDWRKSKAYSLGNFGQIYINLKDREPAGSVHKVDYEKILNMIKCDLLNLHDGKVKLIDKVYLGKEIFGNESLEKIPDLLFSSKEENYLFSGSYDFISNKVFENSVSLTGGHTKKGIFMACGPDIRKFNSKYEIDITDITPTILNLMGIEVIDDFDGRILVEIFTEGKKIVTNLTLQKKSKKKEKYLYNIQEKKELEEKLRNLNYIT